MNTKTFLKSHKSLILSITLVLLTLFVFAEVLQYDFVNYDDDGYVYNNRPVKNGFTINGVNYAFTTIDKGNFIPLTWLSYMLDVEIFGNTPSGHHLTNLFLHILNILLLFLFLKQSTHRVWESFIVAMLFAIHPMHVESVAWISERKDVLSTFFFLFTFIIYGKYAKNHDLKNYFLALWLFLLGLLSKPMLVTLPVLLFLIDIWPFKRIPLSGIFIFLKRHRSLIVEKIPFLVLSIIFSVITFWSQRFSEAMASLTGYPFVTRIVNSVIAYGVYLYKLFQPSHMAVIYPPSQQFDALSFLLSAFVLTGISILVMIYYTKTPCLFVGWLWFLITLLPVIGLIQVGSQSMADRYTYIPFIGLFVGITWGVSHLIIKFRLYRNICITGLCIIIGTFCWISKKQLQTWKNSMTLFEHALLVTENNWIAHFNLGEALFDKGMIEEAIKHYQKALQINPNFELAYLNLGTAFARKGWIDKSIDCYRRAIEIKKNLPTAWLNMGNAYFRKGKIDEALFYYGTTIKMDPDSAEAYIGIGAVMVRKGKFTTAIKAFKTALEIDPDNQAALGNINKIKKYLKKP